jgi:hypothetical protein
MDKEPEPAHNVPAASTTAGFVFVAVLQLMVWLFTATGLDAGFVWGAYSCLLLCYWGVIWLICGLGFAKGRSLSWVVAVTGLLPPVGIVVFLLLA